MLQEDAEYYLLIWVITTSEEGQFICSDGIEKKSVYIESPFTRTFATTLMWLIMNDKEKVVVLYESDCLLTTINLFDKLCQIMCS